MGQTIEAILQAKELLDAQDIPREGREIYMSKHMYKALLGELGISKHKLENKILGSKIVIV